MRLLPTLIFGATFASAAALSLIVAGFAATLLEEQTEISVRRSLDTRGFEWAEVAADGLQVQLSGQAPDEAERFAVLSAVGTAVDAARIIDQMAIKPTKGIAPPRFSTEILRNDAGISIIGLIPNSSNHEILVSRLEGMQSEGKVADFLETAAYSAPRAWDASLEFAINALRILPRAKISVEAGTVRITAIADSAEAKSALERRLRRMLPASVHAELDISAPRPVISPFTLRFILDERGGRFDACSVESSASEVRILRAAEEAGLRGPANCTIGLGVPSANWANAVTGALHALAQIGGGSVTFSNTDVTLIAQDGTEEATFDAVIGELENSLPAVFSLTAQRPVPKEETDLGTPEFTATLSPEGQVQLRGRLTDVTLRHMAMSYAKARFGSDNVYVATRNVEDLPPQWPVRVLAGLEALAHLQRGVLRVDPQTIALRGMSHSETAKSDITGLLARKLGSGQTYDLEITYEAPPEPEDRQMNPRLCEAELGAIQRADKIAIEPGSATVAADSARVLDQIANVLRQCGDIPLEIQGHTDSQGREEMNQALSQSRAESVLSALTARRLLTSSFTARGYGEADPIADNETEEGREANRRIEFRLVASDPTANAEGAQGADGTDTQEDRSE